MIKDKTKMKIKTNKKAQEQKSKILVSMPKKAQEEIVGFALIIIVVAVILLFLLVFVLNTSEKESVESYEVESFIQTALQTSVFCNAEEAPLHLSVQELIFQCYNDEDLICDRNPLSRTEETACEIMNSTLKILIDKSWPVGENRPLKGNELVIIVNDVTWLEQVEGSFTQTYKGATQSFFRSGSAVEVHFRVYS